MIRNRLKCAVNDIQINDRLLYKPDIIEFHLVEQDLFGDRLENLKYWIDFVQKKGIKVYLHHPMKLNGKFLHILSNDNDLKNFYFQSCKILSELSQTFNLKTVLHCNYNNSEYIEPNLENTKKLKNEIKKILSFGREHFLWEDSISGLFSYSNPHLFKEVIQPLNLPLVQDISHSFVALKGNNEKLFELVKSIFPFVEYYHVVDSLGIEHDSLTLGKGNIIWKPIKSFIIQKDFIFEIGLKNTNDCFEMIKSANFFSKI